MPASVPMPAKPVLAISRDPHGGSPTGLPTGPVISSGPLLSLLDGLVASIAAGLLPPPPFGAAMATDRISGIIRAPPEQQRGPRAQSSDTAQQCREVTRFVGP